MTWPKSFSKKYGAGSTKSTPKTDIFWMLWTLLDLIWIIISLNSTYIHIYIHNWPLQPFSQDYDLVSHTTYVVCVNFIHEWRDLQFKVDSERQIFEKLFMAILFTLRVFARNLLRGSRRRNIFFSYFIFDVWPGIRTRALRIVSQHTTYYTGSTKSFNLKKFSSLK